MGLFNHKNTNDTVTGAPASAEHTSKTGSALDPNDPTRGVNSGYGNTTTSSTGMHSGGAGHDISGYNNGPGYGTNDHSTRTGAAVDPTDPSRGVNSGHHNAGYTDSHGHSTKTGAALDPNDPNRGVNSGNTGYGAAGYNDTTTHGHGHGHSTHTGAAVDPMNPTHGVNSGHTTTGAGYNNNNTTTGTTGHSSGGGLKGAMGHVEAAAGSALNSQSLQQKGEAKLREADALKRQGAEVAEAERLEKEALKARERAVNHGAHPGHMNPSGGTY